MERWSGRVALVTGASVGIGATVCRELVQHGMKVIGCARNVEQIQEIVDEPATKNAPGCLHAIKCDLTNEKEILKMFEKIRSLYGRIDVCINNAGLCFDAPLLSGDTKEWRTMLDVNVLALCICSRESIKLMKENGIDDGQIIQISSLAGHRVPPFPATTFYSGTKFMVRALTEGLRRELRAEKSHIRVASISPGVVETEFLYRMMKDPERAKAMYSSLEGLQPKDIADSVTYILQSPPRMEVNDVLIRPVEQSN